MSVPGDESGAPARNESGAPVRNESGAPVRNESGAPARSHRVVLPAVLVLGALAIFQFAGRPLAQQHALIERELADRTAQLASMREAAWQLRARSPRAVSGGGQDGSVLAVVERSARAASLAITRMQPESEHGVRISFEQIGFDALIAWLAELEAGHGLRAHTLHLERLERPGLVAGDVLLAGGAAR